MQPIDSAKGAHAVPPPTATDTGTVRDGAVDFPPWRGAADRPSSSPPRPLPPAQRLGFAVVGLGRLALEQILPALAQSGQAKLAALVSGSPAKLELVARQYGIAADACYAYEDFDSLSGNPEVHAVFIALPNALHQLFVERAAKAGKHVLCEKPLAMDAAQARAMVDACANAGVKLMVAYRIHHQPHHHRVRDIVRRGTYGRVVALHAVNVQTCDTSAAQQWRHKRAAAGGGALPDIGLYCLNTARYIVGEEPIEVFAHVHSPAGDERFREVEETVEFLLRFPCGLTAHCSCSYGARENKWLRLELEHASIDMPNAFDYQGQRLVIGHRRGDDVGLQEVVIAPLNQFMAEIDHFADCIREDREPATPGEEGLRDHLLMEAIYRSAELGRPVRIPSPHTSEGKA